jgi:hypothetical protein
MPPFVATMTASRSPGRSLSARSDQPFAVADVRVIETIDVSSVDERDAVVERGLENANAGRFVGGPARDGQRHAAEADGCDAAGTGAERAGVHERRLRHAEISG